MKKMRYKSIHSFTLQFSFILSRKYLGGGKVELFENNMNGDIENVEKRDRIIAQYALLKIQINYPLIYKTLVILLKTVFFFLD